MKKVQLAKLGKKLGGPRPLEALALANAAKRRATPPMEVLSLMLRLRQDKKSFWAIADELNRLGVRTGRGSHWYASTVRFQLKRLPRKAKENPATPVVAPAPAPPRPVEQQQTRPLGPDGLPMTGVEYTAAIQRRLAQSGQRAR